MERVGILINKLKEQLEQHADAKTMLVTVQMLHTELMQSVQQKSEITGSKVSVVMPYQYAMPSLDEASSPEKNNVDTAPVVVVEAPSNGKVVVPEPAITVDATEQMVEENKQQQAQPIREHTSWIFDPSEAPTFAHQEKIVYELNESMVTGEASLNDKLKIEKIELAHVLHDVPVKDLKKAISINDRHRFIEDLFRGDETMYERSIKTINNFNNFAEAEFWMQRELKLKLAWDNNSHQVKLFDQLVRRRFS